MTQIAKRRLSLFSFGSNSGTNSAVNSNSNSAATSIPTSPPGGKKTLSANPPVEGSNTGGNTATNTQNQSVSAIDHMRSYRGNRSGSVPTSRSNSHANLPTLNSVSKQNGNSGANSNSNSGGNNHSVSTRKLSVNSNLASHQNSSSFSPVSADSNSSMNDMNIFERSVQDSAPPYEQMSRRPTLTKLKSTGTTHNEFGSQASLSNFKNEDFIPPALDATTSILNDSKTNLDDVDIIYSSRRNSSVIGLNMALGRTAPSRKNSVYSMSQLHQPQSPNPNFSSHSAQQVPQLHSPNPNSGSNSNLPAPASETMNQSQSLNHPISPTSPPKLTSSKSSISFYSYADLLSNDEYTKRPSFKQSYSQGIIPSRKNSVNSIKATQPSGLTKKFNSNLNKFLISPESSDSEDDVGSRTKSIDNESLVSSSIGDCLRQTKTELSGST